ncbi:MAG: Eco57I restriction-modification methylase domain-containing protein [Candidatus Acidiferrales bacterium]
MTNIAEIEGRRMALQSECERVKTQGQRNRLGQFATPARLARGIIRLAGSLLPGNVDIRFLDPAFGTGSFYSALLHCFPAERIRTALGFEIDKQVAESATELWRRTALDLRLADFTRQCPPAPSKKFNLIVCNPPYVRHHHLTGQEKARLHGLTCGPLGHGISGLTGLYGYFLLLADAWASEEAVCIWLIPTEFMDVNYGAALKEYLRTKVTLLKVHRFDAEDIQFDDALVSSSIVCFRKSPPLTDHRVCFSFGGSLEEPKIERKVHIADLRPTAKWRRDGFSADTNTNLPRLRDFFDIKRGLATGDNHFFILSREEVQAHHLPSKFLKPILPSPRYLEKDEIEADHRGHPLVENVRFLLDCPLSEEQVKTTYPELWRYLQLGQKDVAKGYLCRSRSPWYSQEKRPAPMFLCTYMGRMRNKDGRAFRFILNRSIATAANVYLLMYPRTELTRALRTQPQMNREVWSWLQNLPSALLLSEGRVYGGGLHKVEPRELGNVPADGLANLVGISPKAKPSQLGFFAGNNNLSAVF